MGGNTTKCGHLSCPFKIIGFHSIFTMHSSYLKGETDNCPTTRIAVDGEVLSYGDLFAMGGEAVSKRKPRKEGA